MTDSIMEEELEGYFPSFFSTTLVILKTDHDTIDCKCFINIISDRFMDT